MEDDGDQGGAAATVGSTTTLDPPPGTNDNTVKVDLVVTAWKKVRALYDHVGPSQGMVNQQPGQPDGLALHGGAARTFDSDFGQCVTACRPYYSDLVCQFYCSQPSYAQVTPAVRGCFSSIALLIPPATTIRHADGTALFYPEIYDYCLYEKYDAVLSGLNPPAYTGVPSVPAYDPQVIAQNKAAGNRVGGMTWLDDNEAEAFKHVMYTWYNPTAFSMASQQETINKFWGVTLANPAYTAADTADVATCMASARKRMPYDPTDGTHCSSAKTLSVPRTNHQDYAKILTFMRTL